MLLKAIFLKLLPWQPKVERSLFEIFAFRQLFQNRDFKSLKY